LLKSTEVEDPINIMVHRPLAYAFVWSIFKTPITPNGVTCLAMVAGIASGACFLVGSGTAMIWAGILLWTAAILDGADGILARAKNMQSQFGRALDGAADIVVACATVFPAFAHMYWVNQDPLQLWLAIPAIVLTAVHLPIYDYYKESYLRMTRLDRGGEGSDEAEITALAEKSKSMGIVAHFTMKHVLLPFVQSQGRLIRLLNPRALREGISIDRDARTVAIYRKHNLWPMRLWTIVSLAPHSYMMAICAMFDRLDIYLWIRLLGMNGVFVIATIWQRRATAATLDELNELGVVHADEPPAELAAA
jgi:phosphatidylglycerophosphate synthase